MKTFVQRCFCLDHTYWENVYWALHSRCLLYNVMYSIHWLTNQEQYQHNFRIHSSSTDNLSLQNLRVNFKLTVPCKFYREFRLTEKFKELQRRHLVPRYFSMVYCTIDLDTGNCLATTWKLIPEFQYSNLVVVYPRINTFIFAMLSLLIFALNWTIVHRGKLKFFFFLNFTTHRQKLRDYFVITWYKYVIHGFHK